MVEPKTGIETGGAQVDVDALQKKYDELLDCLLHEKKRLAIQKHPELASAYKAMEVYEVYFLAGGDWDDVGAFEFKKKMAEKIIQDLVSQSDSSK